MKTLRRLRPLAPSFASVIMLLAAAPSISFGFQSNADDAELLSASNNLEALVARANELWPAHPALIPDYEQWLLEARGWIDGRAADPAHDVERRASLDERRINLADLRRRALQPTAAEVLADRESHPRFAELKQKRAELAWLSRMLRLEPWPRESDVAEELAREALPADALALNALSWSLIDPDKPIYGEEQRGLLLARRALALATEVEDPLVRNSMAWAHFRLGQMDDAVAQEEAALDEAPSAAQKQIEINLMRIQDAVQQWSDKAALADRRKQRDSLLAVTSELDRLVSERRTWTFENPLDSVRQVRLAKLVLQLEALRDPERGLMGDTLAEPFGWGMRKRCEFARTIAEQSLDGARVKQRWRDAIAAIATSTQYAGLKLQPQIGLVPLAQDPNSGLWEFWQIQTGDEPARAADGKWVVTESMGLVFVLIPGGIFWMGAQPTGPSRRNFDSAARPDESPVHEVELSAYFISKYELTQSQWRCLMGSNKSRDGASGISTGPEPDGRSPVEQVSWDDSLCLVKRLAWILPSEAQWEIACRAGTDTPRWTGRDPESLRSQANIAGTGVGTAPANSGEREDSLERATVLMVGSFGANPFGLHELQGNVSEWCLDGYDGNFYSFSPRQNPVAPWTSTGMHVIRGGGFGDNLRDVRSACREHRSHADRSCSLGLRPGREIMP